MRYLAALLILALAPSAAPQTRTPEEKVKLFNGWNLDGFTVFLRDNGANDPRRVFTVRDRKLVISGEEWGALTTVDEWRDYKITVEWRWGGKAWPPREKRARDSGILLHGVGEFNPKRNGWLESYEYQIIEGGTGDMIPVAGEGRPRATAEVRFGPDKQPYFEAGSPAQEFDRQRVNWWGRDVNWRDELGFRGVKDVEKKVGQWNRSEIIAEGDTLRFYLNGRLVNRLSKLSRTAGRIQLQSEGAEIWIRKIELEPVR
jgi:hypothetical protein